MFDLNDFFMCVNECVQPHANRMKSDGKAVVLFFSVFFFGGLAFPWIYYVRAFTKMKPAASNRAILLSNDFI